VKIQFADTFTDSLRTLIRHQTWWYKTYSLFRHDLPRFFKNIWKFRKGLWNHYWFDHHGTLKFLEIGLTDMADRIEKDGMEVDSSRLKKVTKMRRAVELIKNYNESNYIDMAEKELGNLISRDWEFEDIEDKPGFSRLLDNDTEEEKVHNRKVFNRATEIEEKEWKELFEILKGQSHSEYLMFLDKSEDKKSAWDIWFDGSDLRGWWD
jgi:hypothetical protein